MEFGKVGGGMGCDTAIHIDPGGGRSVRFKVENSWGEEAGDKGWFVMTEVWFDEQVSICLFGQL